MSNANTSFGRTPWPQACLYGTLQADTRDSRSSLRQQAGRPPTRLPNGLRSRNRFQPTRARSCARTLHAVLSAPIIS
eukprot:12752317-Alexandrium_andersonii.AAC.1